MPALPPIVSRLVAVGLLLAVVALGWLAAVQPVIAKWYDTEAQIEQTHDLLQRYQEISAGRDELQAELAYWRDEILPQSGVFSGDNRAIVAAELQSTVSNIVKRADGELLSIQILREQTEGDLEVVSVRVQFSAEVESLTSIFYELESVRPYLFIDNLSIRAERGARRVRIVRQMAQPEETGALFVTCDVYGYMRSGSS